MLHFVRPSVRLSVSNISTCNSTTKTLKTTVPQIRSALLDLLIESDVLKTQVQQVLPKGIWEVSSKNVRLKCDQKLVKASLIYRTEPKQYRICKKTVSSPSPLCQSGVHRSRTTTQQSPYRLQWDAQKSHPESKHDLPFDDNHLHLIHPSLDRPYSPPQTASGSIQPFCHSTISGQRD